MQHGTRNTKHETRSPMKLGKIGRLPRVICEQVNRRLQNDEPAASLLEWLNSLPEVKAVLAAEFGGCPVSKQNLSEWRTHGYRDWQMRQAALEFTQDLAADQADRSPLPAGALTDSLAQWVALRYAALAHTFTVATDDDPETELRRLREFCADIVTLRRGDLSAGRLNLEEARLASEQAKSDQEQERRFWEWTKRPDIQAKLYPHRDPDQIRREVVAMVDRELLGIRHPSAAPGAPELDPATLI